MRLSRYPDKKISVAAARADLKTLLASCTDARLDAMTVEGLATSYRVPAREIEYELTIARQRRAARG